MKTKAGSILFAIYLILSTSLCAQGFLTVHGKIDESEFPLKGVKIKAYLSDGALFKTVKTNKEGLYQMELPLISSDKYLVIVSKKGYVSKCFLVSTENIPDSLRDTEFPPIGAFVSLFKPVKGVDYSELDHPMIGYYYNPQKDKYEYDKARLEQMLKVLEKIKQEEREKKQWK